MTSLPLPVGSTPFSLPIAHPSSASTPLPARAPLSPECQQKLTDLIAHFNHPSFELPLTIKDWKPKPAPSRLGSLFRSTPKAEVEVPIKTNPLNEVERCYWSKEAFERCLRATKWNYDLAVKRAEETCVWRRESRVEEINEKDIEGESATGKEIIMGFDNSCRPVLYMHPYRQNTEPNAAQIDFVVWCLERAIDLAPATNPATEMLCLCIDFGSNRSDTKGTPTPIGVAQQVLHILQTYYCERLGKAVCINVPRLFWGFFKIVGPFIDPVTKDKIQFLDKPDATHLIPPAQLQAIFGGLVEFEYSQETYLPAISALCRERKAANLARWRQYGEGMCGISESVIRGAVTPDGVAALPGSANSTVVGGHEMQDKMGEVGVYGGRETTA